jgi:hypothetical protein
VLGAVCADGARRLIGATGTSTGFINLFENVNKVIGASIRNCLNVVSPRMLTLLISGAKSGLGKDRGQSDRDTPNGNKLEPAGVSFDMTYDNSGALAAVLTLCPFRQLVLATLFTAAIFAGGQKPIRTTVCAIVYSPRRFDGKLVQFGAFYESDGIEHSILLDEASCKWGIAPRFPERLAGEDELEKALFTDYPGTRNKVIHATWTGRFHYHPKRIPRWQLQIREMKDFRFTCETCPTLHKDDPIRLPEPQIPSWPPGH